MESNNVNVLKIIKIDLYKKGIRIMLDNAECVYFHPFGKTIITEVCDDIKKETFSEFKKDIVSTNWDVEKLKLKWIKK